MKQKNIFSSETVKEIEGIGPKTGKVLADAGIKTLEDFRRADIKRLSKTTGIAGRVLSAWKSSAVLQRIIGIDRQIAEVLVKNNIRDLIVLRNANPKKILEIIKSAREPKDKYNIIPDTYTKIVTLEKVLMWQCSVNTSHIAPGGFGAPARLSADGYINIWIIREYETKFSTLGSIFIAGRHIYTLEPPDRNNAATDNYLTAGRIFPGSYSSFVRTDGTRGWRIELKNVPARSDIQIHKGSHPEHTWGCILPGMDKGNDRVYDSDTAMKTIKAQVESSGTNPDITVNVCGVPISIINEPPTQPPSTPPTSSGGGW
ncbi:MAG: hypothetical protein CVU77_05795 [Elusimicrobia bacterium HGW-Elusimicrobia-1]|jgi:hypothetical protein|nr:MAG: hypothetical protein CVU77_05795 [Elusimicrobia bacterium HGW-Elusimicrobia-1]